MVRVAGFSSMLLEATVDRLWLGSMTMVPVVLVAAKLKRSWAACRLAVSSARMAPLSSVTA